MSKGNTNIVARVNGSSIAKAGDKIKIALNTEKIHIFDKETENTII
jgi:multiple sugar transport system ATP-binding protein